MKVLVVYAHPNPESFVSALHRAVLAGLSRAGHVADDLDLYAEGFDPVMPLQQRQSFYKPGDNGSSVQAYVDRLRAAEGVVFVYPTWWQGGPAILKGFLDRTLLPGVAFAMQQGKMVPRLLNVRRIDAVTTYGSPWWLSNLYLAQADRSFLARGMRRFCHPKAKVGWHGFWSVNASTPEDRQAHLQRIESAFSAYR
ncbi:MAG TPA: NAD(P)H-dependent oxidoreductase [Ramlibacter sp.]|nr:NAD(P)H-dependent oxidoreductase [Ramlibacter sp.]